MISAILLSVAFLGADEPPATAQPAENPALESYRDAVAKAGKTPEAHVRLALWCEAHGLTAERLKHLSLAVLYEPTNTLARGLMGRFTRPVLEPFDRQPDLGSPVAASK